MTNANIEARLAEIKSFQQEQEALLNVQYPDYCDEIDAALDALQAEVDALKIAAYGEWEASPAYAAFQAKQAANRRARAAA